MTVSRRELILGMLTLGVLVLGGTYVLGRPLLQKWEESGRLRQRLADENKFSARLINQRDEAVKRLNDLRGQLPKYGPTQPVTAELLKLIKRTSDEHQLVLTRLEPDKESQVGDLSEVAIDCQWDGSLESLVHFLYAVQMQGAILDIRQLNIAPMQGVAGRLKGNFTVFCAFSRETPGDAEAPSQPASPPAP
jgi:Tfp pilus assembly protein PilO